MTPLQNFANRWGGGLYVGLSPAWYELPGGAPTRCDPANISLLSASITMNESGFAGNQTSLKPSQIATERVAEYLYPAGPAGFDAKLDFLNSSISGNQTTDIGVYVWFPGLIPVENFIGSSLAQNRRIEP